MKSWVNLDESLTTADIQLILIHSIIIKKKSELFSGDINSELTKIWHTKKLSEAIVIFILKCFIVSL